MQQQPVRVSDAVKVLFLVGLIVAICVFHELVWLPHWAKAWHEFMVDFDHLRC